MTGWPPSPRPTMSPSTLRPSRRPARPGRAADRGASTSTGPGEPLSSGPVLAPTYHDSPMTASADRRPLTPGDFQIAGRRRTRERLVRAFFLSAAALSIVVSVAIVFALLGNALYFLINVDKSSLVTDGWF